MMFPAPSNKNIPTATKKKLFTDKDHLKFDKIMSTRNLIRHKMEMKFQSNDVSKKPVPLSTKTINNVRILYLSEK
jgi:hypothetical protein